jgi:hypothetical protein
MENNSGNVELEVVKITKDLGVIIDDSLRFEEHIKAKVKKAYSMLGLIKRNFNYMDADTFMRLYKTMVRSQLEYAVSVWSPYKKSLIVELERVQKRATKMVRNYSKLTYSERLKKLKLPTLVYRRMRGDVIEAYKILTGRYDGCVTPRLELNTDVRTRGNTAKLKVYHTKYDLRKFSFNNRIVAMWNDLPDFVIQSESLNIFKKNLDRHWVHQEVLYHHKASFTGTR